MHFSMHTIPHEGWIEYLGYTRSRDRALRGWDDKCVLDSSTPLEYIGTVARWPEHNLDLVKLQEDYALLSALETPCAGWGVPSLDRLSVSQSLSFKLVQAILIDHADIFSNPDVLCQRRLHNMCCWKIVSAAAPSLLRCLPMSTPQLQGSDVLGKTLGGSHARPPRLSPNLFLWYEDNEEQYYADVEANIDKSWDHLYWTLRGCLVGFCPRLDTPDFVKSEVLSAVEALKRSPSGKTVALIFSGRHVMAVSIGDRSIRHTPPVVVHDPKLAIQDGALLMIHLLNTRLGNKTFEALSQPNGSDVALTSGTLPPEILYDIIHYTDHDTFQGFASVCRYTRSICLSYPRVNNSTLLQAVNGGFLVRDVGTGCESVAHMRRVGWKVHKDLDSTFHVRQSGYGTASQAKKEFVVVNGIRIYRNFTYSERSAKMTAPVNLRMIGVWGQWVMQDGVVEDENAATTPQV